MTMTDTWESLFKERAVEEKHFYVAFQIIGSFLFLINCYISISYTILLLNDNF